MLNLLIFTFNLFIYIVDWDGCGSSALTVDSGYFLLFDTLSWQQHPTKHELYGHLPPITKIVQFRRTRHAGHSWRCKDELISDLLLWAPHMAKQKQDDQLEHTYSSCVRILDVALKTCQRRWTIGRSGERGSGIFVLTARHDDDDDDDVGICGGQA